MWGGEKSKGEECKRNVWKSGKVDIRTVIVQL